MVFLSDISVGSIQSAVQALSAVKAKMYEPKTTVYPKLVGFEAPTDQLDAIPALVRELYRLDFNVCPRLASRPGSDPAKNDKYLWIQWSGNKDCTTGQTRRAIRTASTTATPR